MSIKNVIITIYLCITISLPTWAFQEQLFTLMIDPAGDAENPGRKIYDSFERGITLQFAETLKKTIEETYPQIRIVLSRFPGETIQPLQNANFANRLDVDFYLHIGFYEEQATKPSIDLYTFSYDNNSLHTKPVDLAFYSADKAYLISNTITNQSSDIIKSVLTKDSYHHKFDFKKAYTLPFAPLFGIKSPAIAFEIGLKTKDGWLEYIQPIAESINAVIEKRIKK